MNRKIDSLNYKLGKQKTMFGKLLFLMFFGSICSTTCYAASEPAQSMESIVVSSKLELSENLLDTFWDNRENENSQKIIIKYLQGKPTVPNNYKIAWKIARLVYFTGNYGVGEAVFIDSKTANFKSAEDFFNYGVEAGKKAIELNPSGVEGYYWYAIDLSSWGLAKGILASAWHAKDGMKALKQAMTIDPAYHWYRSSRVLGRYYQELPRMFGGNKDEARRLFILATEKSPKFDNNWIYLGQFYNAEGDYDKGLQSCQTALTINPPLDGKFEEERYKKEVLKCVKANQAKRKIEKS